MKSFLPFAKASAPAIGASAPGEKDVASHGGWLARGNAFMQERLAGLTQKGADANGTSGSLLSVAPATGAFAPNGAPSTSAVNTTGPSDTQLSAAPSNAKPASNVDIANAAFQESLRDGSTNLGALWDATKASPKGVGRLFLEAFVDSKLEPLTAPMHLGSTIAGMSPDPGLQLGSSILGYSANAVDASVGLITGDEQKTACAASDILTSAVLDGSGIKTQDGRVSPTYLNGDGGISEAGQEVLTNNLAITAGGEAAGAVGGCGTTVDNAKTTWESLTGITELFERPYAKQDR
ncbi:MAG: hypothetical protein ACOZNI_19750 [Myxococcota bacterium]